MVNVAVIQGKTLTSASCKDWIFESLDKGSSMDFFFFFSPLLVLVVVSNFRLCILLRLCVWLW